MSDALALPGVQSAGNPAVDALLQALAIGVKDHRRKIMPVLPPTLPNEANFVDTAGLSPQEVAIGQLLGDRDLKGWGEPQAPTKADPVGAWLGLLAFRPDLEQFARPKLMSLYQGNDYIKSERVRP